MTGTAPAVPQIPAGYGPFPPDMTAWITTPFTFLATKVMFRGQLQAANALSAGAWTQASLDTILEDPYSGWSAVATGSQAPHSWLCPPGCSGWYEISMTGTTASQGSTPTQCGAALWVNGSEYRQSSLSPAVNGNTSGSAGVAVVPLLGGSDYVQMRIFSSAAVNTPALAGRYPTMEVAWIGS